MSSRTIFGASYKRWLIVLVVGILTLAGIIGGLWATNIFGWRAWRIQEVQAFIGAPIPTGATDVQFSTRNQYGRIVWLRFSLPQGTDLQPFLKAIKSNISLKEGFTPFHNPNPQEAGIAWWTPLDHQHYSGLYWNTGSKILELLSVSDDSKKIVIFLRAYILG